MATTFTVGMADAKTNFSRITANVNRTGIPVTVFKNNKPWVEIRPWPKGLETRCRRRRARPSTRSRG